MCGIIGIVQFDKKPVQPSVLKKMTEAIAHRGPDDEGSFIDQNIGLGHRRLAILDLSPLGHQPMFNEDKSLAIVFNGEIYNYQEIAKKFKKRHRIVSTSDTEMILHAYEEWGPNCVQHFNGMWAFVIYDRKKQTFFVSRDRLGIKPLYYFCDEQKFICASEIKAILQYPGIKTKLNYQALNEYFTFQNILSDQTLFSGIHLLEPGHNLFVTDKVTKNQYWDASFDKKDYQISQWQDKLLATLREGIWRHLNADVPVGTLLSGGMDSTTIARFASQKNPRFMTFTGGFDLAGATGREANLDERKEAEMVARSVSSEHYEIILEPQNVSAVMPKLIWHMEDLRLALSYPQYYIARLASKFVKVCLSGTGGDEIFGGYPWRYQLVEKARRQKDFDQIQYSYWSRLIKDDQKDKFFTPEILTKIDVGDSYRQYQKIIAPARGQNPVDKAIYFEQKTFLHGFFIVEDKMFMAHSLEGRVPMTDFELVKLVNAMPSRFKYKNGLGKILFRKTMNRYLPQEIINKRKTGFTAPEMAWYKNQLKEYMREMILGKRALARGIFEKSFLEKIWQEHLHGKDRRLILWSLLSFEWWNRVFLEGEGKAYES